MQYCIRKENQSDVKYLEMIHKPKKFSIIMQLGDKKRESAEMTMTNTDISEEITLRHERVFNFLSQIEIEQESNNEMRIIVVSLSLLRS